MPSRRVIHRAKQVHLTFEVQNVPLRHSFRFGFTQIVGTAVCALNRLAAYGCYSNCSFIVTVGKNQGDANTLGFCEWRIFRTLTKQTAASFRRNRRVEAPSQVGTITSPAAPLPRSNDRDPRGFDDPLVPR
jgi:hypothetical protein